jgi:hypothetical protein
MQSGPPSLSFEYMEASHYPFGMHTVGGVFFRAISMMSEEKKSVLFLCFELLDSDCRKKRGGSISSSVRAGWRFVHGNHIKWFGEHVQCIKVWWFHFI